MKNIHKGIVTALGSGFSPFAPGTAGSIVGIAFIFGLNSMLMNLHVSMLVISIFHVATILLVVFGGVFSIKRIHQIWPHDDQRIVIDEVAGVLIASLAMPVIWYYYLSALVLFRIFDIAKPFGIRKLDNMKSDWSVMLDDVLAGIYALLVFWLIYGLLLLIYII